jgi:F-type H+-transporting ATPase subunit delta
MTGGIEKVYSEALYELAAENGSEEETNEELSAVAGIFGENAGLYSLLSAPTIADNEKTEALDNIFGGRISDTTLNFLCLITKKGRIRHLKGIADAFKALWYESAGIMEVGVTAARPLTPKQKSELSDKLEQKYGKKIIMTEKTDPDILGGVIVSFGDTMLDGSVRTKLSNMRSQMKNVIA